MNKNTVQLIGTYSDDEGISCAAWTSTSRELTEEKRNRIPQFLKRLADDGHHSPFERGIVQFLVNTSIDSHIHLIKHRLANINSESARYKEIKEDKYYLPEDWKDIKTSEESNSKIYNKYAYCIDSNDNWQDILKWYTDVGNFLYHQSLKDITPVLGRKRAKESCRYFKTYNSQICADVQMNLRCFLNFQNLRNSEHAQKEIRDIAKEMLRLVFETGKFNHSLKAFGYERDLLGKVEKSNHPS